jgi:hypothetical protein
MAQQDTTTVSRQGFHPAPVFLQPSLTRKLKKKKKKKFDIKNVKIK